MSAPQVKSFTRVYPTGDGLEHPATPEFVRNVLKSMNEARDSSAPFYVRFRMSDGSTTVVRPKRGLSVAKLQEMAHD